MGRRMKGWMTGWREVAFGDFLVWILWPASLVFI